MSRGDSGDATMARWLAAQEPEIPAPRADLQEGPTRALDAYEGSYANPAWGSFKVRREGDRLNIRFGAFEAPLEHARYDNFGFAAALGWERMRLRFEAGFDGNIGGFMLDDGTYAQPQWFERLAPVMSTPRVKGQ